MLILLNVVVFCEKKAVQTARCKPLGIVHGVKKTRVVVVHFDPKTDFSGVAACRPFGFFYYVDAHTVKVGGFFDKFDISCHSVKFFDKAAPW